MDSTAKRPPPVPPSSQVGDDESFLVVNDSEDQVGPGPNVEDAYERAPWIVQKGAC